MHTRNHAIEEGSSIFDGLKQLHLQLLLVQKEQNAFFVL